MSAVGLLWLRKLSRCTFAWRTRPRTGAQRKRKAIPGVEPLEAMALLSAGASVLTHAAVRVDHAIKEKHVKHANNAPIPFTGNVSYDPTSVTPAGQTVSLGQTLTNFANDPLSPVLNLFNPTLGTLLSVTVSHTATIQSDITVAESQSVVGNDHHRHRLR